MRRLLLLRHAKSDWSIAGHPDHARELAPRGRKAAPLMGQYIAEHGLTPDHAIVSTAARTRQTWQALGDDLTGGVGVTYEKRIYEAEPEDILEAIQDAPKSAQSLIVVGHNPGLQETALLLTNGGKTSARRAISAKFPTAGLAVIDLDIDDWSDIAPGHGTLERFITPRALGGEDD